MLTYRSSRRAHAAGDKLGPQFRGSLLYRTPLLRRVRALTFFPWGVCDVPLAQLKAERSLERLTPMEFGIRRTLVSVLRQVGVDL